MGRHGMKYCLLCNPYGNGLTGYKGTEAVAKYYLPPDSADGQATSGWIPICEGCIAPIKQYFKVILLTGEEIVNGKERMNQELLHGGQYNHAWEKQNLVTQKDPRGMYDLLKCKKCGAEIKRRELNKPLIEKGCSVG